MSTFLDIALPLAERGFRVFPLIPQDKRPVKMSWGDHFDAATTARAPLEQWSRECPRANVGISPDEMWCFLETDDEAALHAACSDISPEVWDTARVSARDNRCYYIFRQTMRTRKAGNMTVPREGQENLFEFKQHRVYVTGPGSIHPKTGKPYGVEWRTIPAMPDILLNRLCELYGAPKTSEAHKMDAETSRQTALLDKFLETYEVATTGDWFPKGKQWYQPIGCPWADSHENRNQGTSTCIVYTEGGGYGFDCKHRCEAKTWKEFRAEVQGHFPDRKFSFVEPTPEVTIGSSQAEPTKPKDWRARYHTKDEMLNAPPISFLIEGFLQCEGVTGLAAPVRERKSLIALNIAHALVTGEPLFDHFKVLKRPSRVLYLCPEVSLGPFTDRLKKIGLMDYVGETLFCRTLSAEGQVPLSDLKEELPGSVVILDTAIRFIEGDESSSADVRKFADTAFALLRGGAESVLLLHHSPKSQGDGMTLENALRGSGDLGAFLACCWGTKLQDPTRPYESASYLENLKQRDFASDPFEVTSGPDCRLHIVSTPTMKAPVLKSRNGRGDGDGKDAAAEDAIRANLEMSLRKLEEHLAVLGIKRGTNWIGKARKRIIADAARQGIRGVVVREGTA
jgi:hypothetical protein